MTIFPPVPFPRYVNIVRRIMGNVNTGINALLFGYVLQGVLV